MYQRILRILLKNYTKIGINGGISKVIFDDRFEDITEEIVKLFAIPDVVGSFIYVVISKVQPLSACKNCPEAYRRMNKFKKTGWADVRIEKLKVF